MLLLLLIIIIITIIMIIIRRTEGTEEQGVSDPTHLSFLVVSFLAC